MTGGNIQREASTDMEIGLYLLPEA